MVCTYAVNLVCVYVRISMYQGRSKKFFSEGAKKMVTVCTLNHTLFWGSGGIPLQEIF